MRPPLSPSGSKCSSSSSSSSYSLAATSLNSRLMTVFKKAEELTTLCDIEACVIHYGLDGELKTWPENRDKVKDLALRYIQLDEAKRRKKSVDLYQFLNKKKDKKKTKRTVEELKYQINQLIQSLELSYSKLQERRRLLAEKANLEDRQQSLNPSHVTKFPQESCVYDANNNNFQHLCVSSTPDYSAVQESGLHYQLMPYDQNMMCTGNQDPCVSSIQDYSVFPLELEESVSNYGLMEHELYYGFDQSMRMSDTTNINNVLDPPCLSNIVSDYFCFDSQSYYGGNPSFSQGFPDMSSSYVDENRQLLQGFTLPSL